jgi:hypothetical protein
MPYLVRNGERAERKKVTARESTADLSLRAERTTRDWPVRTGDKAGTELGDPDQWQKCLTSRSCMGNREKERAGRVKKPRKFEAAMEGTL